MKVKYTPGTPDGLVGKTYKVEIVGIKMLDVPHISYPIVREVKIKYDNGKTEWIDGNKLYLNILDTKDVIRYSY